MRKTPNPVDVHVGARVRLRRLSLGMSQEKLGDELGLTFQQVQKYEKGANRMGASRLYAIAKILDTSVSFFFEGLSDPNGSDGASASPLINTPEAVELNRAFSRIDDPTMRRRLTELVKSVAPSDDKEP